MNLRVKATALHLLGSAVVAAGAAALVYGLWYPSPLAALAGGAALFQLLIGIDLVLGPALTAVVANPRKPRRELWRDILVILTVQLAALGYGLYAMAAARPVGLVFEVDMFRIVSANEIDQDSLSQAPPELKSASWSGPRVWAAVKPTTPEEQLRTIDLGLAGVHLAALPAYWRPYAQEAGKAWQLARPVAAAPAAPSEARQALDALARDAGVAPEQLRTLPVLARGGEGTVVLAPPEARVLGILPGALPP